MEDALPLPPIAQKVSPNWGAGEIYGSRVSAVAIRSWSHSIVFPDNTCQPNHEQSFVANHEVSLLFIKKLTGTKLIRKNNILTYAGMIRTTDNNNDSIFL